MSDQYDRFAWHENEAKTVRVQRLAADRFGYFVEVADRDLHWLWVAVILVYSPTNYRVFEGKLNDDDLFEAAGLGYNEYRSRPMEEK